MPARVLVVDDIPVNVRLLEAKLMAEYYDVITAENGFEALDVAASENPDIILLDVMMPGLDGFEVCRRLKDNEQTTHIPVVMVTALDQQSDRVKGLSAGADDFLTKPVDDVALFARIKSLVRVKMLSDELRLRHVSGQDFGVGGDSALDDPSILENANILVVEDRPLHAKKIAEDLGKTHCVQLEENADEALFKLKNGFFDLAVVSLSLQQRDALRLCSHIRSLEETRHLPILILVEDGERDRLIRGLEMGVNDYVMRPIDPNEMTARVNTQIKRKRYQDRLRDEFHTSLEAAVKDQLTGLYNRRYLSNHLGKLLERAREENSHVSCLIIDMDFFKNVNDQYGHDVGDEVLREFGQRLANNVREMDLACRYGGEEFVLVLPDTDISFAYMIAERLRQEIADEPFVVSTGKLNLNLTISIGVTASLSDGDTAESFLKRADEALYSAKRDGRNRVVATAA